MPLPPNTTPVPQPIFMPGMTPTTAVPTPSPLPVRSQKNAEAESSSKRGSNSTNGSAASPKADFDLPRLRLHINDISHAGASIFLSSVNASTILPSSVRDVQRCLYASPAAPHTYCPPTRSVTLILRDMDGVAYTTGTDLDDDHKEIHMSLRYVAGIQPPTPARRTSEIAGVVTHELVHCYQWNGRGAGPGGLIEGVADWVRLRCDLAPPHWRREVGAKWDAGYQHTAYFLEYLETRFGEGTVRRVNEKLRTGRYVEKLFWTELLGRPVEQLWEDYKETMKKEKEEEESNNNSASSSNKGGKPTKTATAKEDTGA